MRNTSSNFWAVNWGPDEAKGDKNLSSYFVKIPEYDDLLEGQYRYIIGRKGTGKTAILEQLKNDVDLRHDAFYKYLSLKAFPLQELRGFKDRSFNDKSQFVPIWTFLILIELCKLLIEDESAQPGEEIMGIKEFINKNFPEGISFVSTIKYLSSNNNKVFVSPTWMGFEASKSDSFEISTTVHYQKVTEKILECIKKLNAESCYYILFDELDEGYNAGDSGLRLLLLALLRSVENIHLELNNSQIKYRPVLALRSDIFDNLEDNDLNKLDDYLIRLEWTTESQSPYSLYNLVNQRINASINVLNPVEAWSCIANNCDSDLPFQVKTVWDFIYNRTFERPRDIVKYLKFCKKLNGDGMLNFDCVKSAEIKYSQWFYNEFRDEIQSYLPIWKESSETFIKIGKGIVEYDEIANEMMSNSQIKNWLEQNKKTPVDILEILFNFGLIGNLNNSKKWFFKYKDHDLPFNYKHKMIVHFGFTRKFRIKTF
jgi:hypothetical protein